MRGPLLAAVVVPFLAGCSAGSVSDAPQATYDAAGISQAALNNVDRNKNGQIEGAELDASPALKSALPAIDKNNDRSLSASEIQQRVEQYAKLGTISLSCTVTLDGQPLSEATVSFEPEPYMGTSLKSGTTTTDKDGLSGTFQVDGRSFASLPPGLYRIRVTKDGAPIPARYNTQTTLGREVMIDPRHGDASIDLTLSSR
jgi:hypothetical protein